MLGLYDSQLTTWYNSDQITSVIQSLPLLGLWSWDSLPHAERKNDRLGNLHNHLNLSPTPTKVTTAFCQAFEIIFWRWHRPSKAHRHCYFTTDHLLQLGESLYGLVQAQARLRWQALSQQLLALQDSAAEVRQLTEKQQQLELQLEQLSALPRKTIGQWLRRWWLFYRVADFDDRLRQQTRRLRTETHWDERVKKAQYAQIFALTQLIQSELVLEAKLTELPTIALAMVLASDCVQQQTDAESRIRAWRTSPPWANTESLLTALAPSDWSRWQTNAGAPLYVWEDQLRSHGHETTRRLQMAAELFNAPQPRLQEWLGELTTTESPALLNVLKLAWQQAQQQANALAYILRALANPNWQGNLFAQAQSTQSLESTDSHDDQALAAIILGDSVRLVEKAVTAWLEKSAPLEPSQSIVEQLNALKQRFNRLVAVSQPTYPQLANQVHGWASVLLTEIMPQFPPGTTADFTQLWDLLERGRIGLTGLTMRLPTDWQTQLSKVLWQSLAHSIYSIAGGNDTTNHPWPPSLKFIEITNSWQQKRPSVAQAQQYLSADEALVQLFLDTQRDCYRVLWLDRDGLQLRELPADCATANLWWVPELKTGVIAQWDRGFKGLESQARSGGFGGIADNEDMMAWTAVLEATPVQCLASTLNHWAANLNQLTVIFPAPLGQLPWEALPGLESLTKKLVRAISVTHWLTTARSDRQFSQPTRRWVTADPSGEEQCMR
jgi:hypothetical protein